MYRDQIFAIAIIVLLGALCLFLYNDSLHARRVASQVIDGWLEREDNLIELCQIDYDQALIDKQKMIIGDWNDFVLNGG